MLPKDMIGQYSGSLGLALQNYFKISSNEKPSRTKVSSTILADSTMDLEAMISEHDRIVGEYHSKYNKISWGEMFIQDFSFLDLKIKIAEKLLEKCVLCEKKCKIDRRFEIGSCQVIKPIIASEFLHMGEEKPLIPSHTIFFSGCNFKCTYCQIGILVKIQSME
jgi:putative pyruvate formate lyase activating enzyme